MDDLSTILFNADPVKPRLVTENGREYLVTSATSIVPGVLSGSQGALYYPADHVARRVSNWDKVPLTVFHPHDAGGRPCSVNESKQVREKFTVGFPRNSVYDGKLKHEFWFDVEKTKDADRRFGTNVYETVKAGKKMELSTGLQLRQLPDSGGTFNGRAYAATVVDYQPDHIAVLPRERGACSLADGCGVNNRLPCPVCEGTPVTNQEPDDKTVWTWVKNLFRKSQTNNQSQETVMSTRKENVTYLATNCECYKGKEKLLENKDNFSDDDLAKLVENVNKIQLADVVTNTLVEEFGDDAVEHFTTNAMPAFIKAKIAAKEGDPEEDDEEVVEESPVVAAKKKPMPFNQHVREKEKETKVTNANKPLTLDEWESSLPPAAQEIWNSAKRVDADRRAELTTALNAVAKAEKDPARKALIVNKLKSNPNVAVLEDLYTLVRPTRPVRNSVPDWAPRPHGNYVGNGGGPDLPPATDHADPDLALNILTMEDVEREILAKKTA